MGKFPVSIEKESALLSKMQELGILESEVEEKFIRGSGSGGQKINKTSSTVYLHYLRLGIELKCQKTRSQSLNRYHARVALCRKVDRLINQQESEEQQKREKIKRQKRKRTKRQKEKILNDKKYLAKTKKMRKRVESD
jgi:peptide chain release factor